MAFSNSSPSSSGLEPFGPGNTTLISSNRKLLESGEFSDVTIVCGLQQFKAHQFILCPRSPFFATALRGSFLEGHTKTIELPEDDPTTVHRMLQYLYTLQYSIQEPNSESKVEAVFGGHDQWKSSLQSHCAVYILAEKLDIPDLKQYSLGQFKIKVYQDELWDLESFLEVAKSALSMLPTSDGGLVLELLDLCVEHIGKCPETLVSMSGGFIFGEKMETGTTKKIEDQRLMHDRWQDMLKENPLFTVALLRKLVRRRSEDLQRSYDSLQESHEKLKTERKPMRQDPTRLRLISPTFVRNPPFPSFSPPFDTPFNPFSNNR